MRSITTLVGLATAAIGLPAAAATSTLTIPPATAVGMRIVIIHNQIRSGAGVGPIYWDASLAASADAWANELARTGRWGHSPAATRPGQGENLWMGTRGAFSIDQMIGSWAGEGRWFRPGTFPDVSRTGNWEQVGHYTQIVWRGTARVGCALRSSAQNDYLVCRYSPAGNVLGVAIP
ncbi:MAG TPA: CAP domain-containing protein [Sphingomicrobium sp.]